MVSLKDYFIFTGTITEVDSNDHMVDTVGMGYTERRKINEKIITEKVSYREGFRTMIESVHHPFNEMEALVRKGAFISLSIPPPLPFPPKKLKKVVRCGSRVY